MYYLCSCPFKILTEVANNQTIFPLQTKGFLDIKFSSASVHKFYEKCTMQLIVFYCYIKTTETAAQSCFCKVFLRMFWKLVMKTAAAESSFTRLRKDSTTEAFWWIIQFFSGLLFSRTPLHSFCKVCEIHWCSYFSYFKKTSHRRII